MGKIVFYEESDFQGLSYECSMDHIDLHSHLAHCNSIRIISGCWMVFEREGFTGHQYFLKRGDYPDYQHWMGFNDSIRSCRIIPKQRGSFSLRLYEKEDFSGQTKEFTNDCPHIFEEFKYHDIPSCNVLDGHWIFYEQPNYRGRQYYLKPGEYRRFTDWGALSPRISSLKRVQDFY